MSTLIDALCPIKVPDAYQVFKDIIPLLAACIAVAGGLLGYFGLANRMRFDRQQRVDTIDHERQLRIEAAITRSKCLAIELRVRMNDVSWFLSQITEKDDAFERFTHLRDHVFTKTWMRALKTAEATVNRGWTEIASTSVEHMERLARCLAATQAAIENVLALDMSLKVEAAKLDAKIGKFEDLAEAERESLEELHEYAAEIATTLSECLEKFAEHVGDMVPATLMTSFSHGPSPQPAASG
jgi:hypothetical protein